MAKGRAESDTVQINWRMKEPLRRALELSAKKRGISMNQEITRCVEAFYSAERRVDEAFGNQEIFGLMKVVSAAFIEAARGAAGLVSAKNFVDNPFVYDQGAKAALKVLDAFRPSGKIEPPANVTGLSEHWNAVLNDINANPGQLSAEGLLDKIRSDAGLPARIPRHVPNKEKDDLTPVPADRRTRRLREGLGDKLTQRLAPKTRGT